MIKILYEDNYLAVAEKPANMLSEESSGGNDIITLLSKQLNTGIFSVHRLDKETGGAMVFAKTKDIAGKLSELIRQKDFEKEYIAVVKGCPEAEAVYEDLLYRDKAKNKTYVVKRMRKGVKDAKLEFKRLATDKAQGLSLVRVRLHTGRTHQIRVQFASRQFPLMGDTKYGGKDGRCSTALWSCLLAFTHPVTGIKIRCESLPDKAFPWNIFQQ